jgi:hypothetical protein
MTIHHVSIIISSNAGHSFSLRKAEQPPTGAPGLGRGG